MYRVKNNLYSKDCNYALELQKNCSYSMKLLLRFYARDMNGVSCVTVYMHFTFHMGLTRIACMSIMRERFISRHKLGAAQHS